jgi:ubiquinone/menaquinone biosynthesis C-methylase UbiE
MEKLMDRSGSRLSKKKPEDNYKTCKEIEFLEELLTLDGKSILELGCGKAGITRLISTGGEGRKITATEVDEIQHNKNLLIDDLPNVTFVKGGSEDIPLKDGKVDVVFMFKSLHHVPVASMDDAFKEVKRVLKPGGLVYVSEPVYGGAFNDIIRLFNEEKEVRDAAYNAVNKSVTGLGLSMVEEIFIYTPLFFKNFEEFETSVINVTHRENRLSPEIYKEVKEKFSHNMDGDGKRFLQPVRINLLQKR